VRRAIHLVLAMALGVILPSCSEDLVAPKFPPPTSWVIGFVNRSGIDDIHTINQIMVEGMFEAFSIEYGPAMDCPLGCVYWGAFGLRLGTKIGWLAHTIPSGTEVDSLTHFDVEATDTVLFDEALWSRMEENDATSHYLHTALLPVVALDEDSPLSVLRRQAEGLASYIHPHIAWNLLRNPAVQANREILTILSELPVYRGDPYDTARERALELLELLDSRQGEREP